MILYYSLLFLSVRLRKEKWAKAFFIGLCVIFAGDLVFWNLKDRLQKDLILHFIDVGCGNMTLICFPNGTTYLYDCNITNDNEGRVVAYLDKVDRQGRVDRQPGGKRRQPESQSRSDGRRNSAVVY